LLPAIILTASGTPIPSVSFVIITITTVFAHLTHALNPFTHGPAHLLPAIIIMTSRIPCSTFTCFTPLPHPFFPSLAHFISAISPVMISVTFMVVMLLTMLILIVSRFMHFPLYFMG
tara:strand:- start:145 stop:495 length:351 start_codon:yes stop_codon:yes gene_type:complete